MFGVNDKPKAALDLLANNFDLVDSNSDGVISKQELSEFSQDPEQNAGAKAAAEFALRNYDEFAQLAPTSAMTKFKPLSNEGEQVFGRYFLDSAEGLTRKDVAVLNTLRSSDGFDSDLSRIRSTENLFKYRAAVHTVGSLLFGTIAILNPEPATKVFAGALTLTQGTQAGISWYLHAHRQEPVLRREFDQRQQMIRSWK